MAVFIGIFARGTFRNFVPSSPSLSHQEHQLALTVTISVMAVSLFETIMSRNCPEKVVALKGKRPPTGVDFRLSLGFQLFSLLESQVASEVA